MRQIRIYYLTYHNKCIMTAAEMTPMVTYDDRKENVSVSVKVLKKASPTRDMVLFQVAVGSPITIIHTCTC